MNYSNSQRAGVILYLTALLFGAYVFIATIAGRILGVLTWEIFFLLLIIVITYAAIGIKAIWNRISYKSYYYPWKKIRTIYNYIVLEKKITYRRDSGDTLHYCRTMKIRCCSNQLDHAQGKYIWTGIQPSQLKVIPAQGVAEIKDKTRIGIWKYFDIVLNNHMGRGEEQEISYRWPNLSDCSVSSPFFSVSTDEPTQKVVLSLELGEEYANQEIICEEFRAIEADYPINSITANLNERGSYTWEIPRPKIKRFRYYRIRWSWEKGQPATETK